MMETLAVDFEGTSAHLLSTIAEPDKKPKDWPGTARAVTQRLHKQAPVLRRVGWLVENDQGDNKESIIRWTIQSPRPT